VNELLSQTRDAGYLDATPINPELGRMIQAASGQTLRQLPSERVIELFQHAGLLVFRNFGATLEDFSDFTRQFTAQFVIHRNSSRRQIGQDPTIQTVFTDRGALPFHGEMYYVPARSNCNSRPDILWFYCIQPGRNLGETIFCDGIQVWESLSQDARDCFERHRLRYRHRTPSSVWRSLSPEPSSFLDNLARVPGVTNCRVEASGDLQWDYVTPAAQKTKYTDRIAFVNSLLPPSDAYEVTFEDGSYVPQELRRHVLRTTERLCVPIHWQELDVAMVDNTRCMHGRYSNDEDRKIVVRMSIANF
jgi:alpha-ketoglutarate-dependent taurine dioxygenase